MRRSVLGAALVGLLNLAGCGLTEPAKASLGPDLVIDCGPVPDAALCRDAVAVAATAKLNPPPIVKATLRRPRADDACTTAFHACGPASVIVTIQSGDTLQEIPLVPTAGGWIRLDHVR
jgi:hypothetical protein